jgi:hypothetical protein
LDAKKASLTKTSRCTLKSKAARRPFASLYLGQAPLTPLTEIGESLTKVSSYGVASTHAMTVGVSFAPPNIFASCFHDTFASVARRYLIRSFCLLLLGFASLTPTYALIAEQFSG